MPKLSVGARAGTVSLHDVEVRFDFGKWASVGSEGSFSIFMWSICMPCWFKKRDGAKPHKQQLRIRMHPLKQHLSFFSLYIYIFVFSSPRCFAQSCKGWARTLRVCCASTRDSALRQVGPQLAEHGDVQEGFGSAKRRRPGLVADACRSHAIAGA